MPKAPEFRFVLVRMKHNGTYVVGLEERDASIAGPGPTLNCLAGGIQDAATYDVIKELTLWDFFNITGLSDDVFYKSCLEGVIPENTATFYAQSWKKYAKKFNG